jgi:serine/threonine protein kinase
MGVCLEPEKLCIITELMTKGSLYDILRDPQLELPFSVQVHMVLDCLKGLQFIHSAGFIHRDLKYAPHSITLLILNLYHPDPLTCWWTKIGI